MASHWPRPPRHTVTPMNKLRDALKLDGRLLMFRQELVKVCEVMGNIRRRSLVSGQRLHPLIESHPLLEKQEPPLSARKTGM